MSPRVGQGPLVRAAPADLVHPPPVVDKERVEKAVVSYSGQDMVGDPGPWEAKERTCRDGERCSVRPEEKT